MNTLNPPAVAVVCSSSLATNVLATHLRDGRIVAKVGMNTLNPPAYLPIRKQSSTTFCTRRCRASGPL